MAVTDIGTVDKDTDMEMSTDNSHHIRSYMVMVVVVVLKYMYNYAPYRYGGSVVPAKLIGLGKVNIVAS